MKKILKGADGAIFFAIYRQYFSNSKKSNRNKQGMIDILLRNPIFEISINSINSGSKKNTYKKRKNILIIISSLSFTFPSYILNFGDN
ncbi:unnamed protein product [Rhizophagus irregularis]|nr:unnamed protein product [Rhizophagus irregularis]CAB5346069.1 unnamed protein product [Rhizophagus irregularis]